ncbi:MAG: hypothetical protein WCS89_04235 [Candidatus Paceibacterota bacterium]|jgi:hypothetical protein
MSQKKIITATEEFPITPEHIDASQHLFDAFDHSETEVSAGWIVRFMQARGKGWTPFTQEEIETFYSKKFNDGFHFNRLVNPQMIPPSLVRAFEGYMDPLVPAGGGWIILADDKKYYVTDDFVIRCFKSQPVKKIKKQVAVVA